ncbi:MAG: HAMP domain-containing histidine kinase [Oscillospiraceae bacterium]|jgi:signal transduction histidine kinase|nr:HAMP domain-containing histidine kinase [Oscillospiraceae bacterium]
MRSIFFKSFLLTAALILVSFLALGVVFVGLASNLLAWEREEQLGGTADIIAQWRVGYYINGDQLSVLPGFPETLNMLGEMADANVFMANASGRIVVCSDINCAHLGKFLPDEAVRNILNDQRLSSTVLTGLFDDERVTVGRVLLSPSGRVGGYLLVSATAQSHRRLTEGFARIFFMVGMAVMIFACLSAYWSSRRMTAPLRLMRLASRRFAQGDFAIRIPHGASADEIDELSESFNAMADALQKADELRSEFIANVSHELKTPMTTISGFIDGVLDGTIPPDKSEEYLGAIRDEVRRLSRLVSSMLGIARLQAGQTVPIRRTFDIVDLVCRTLLSFEGAVEKRGLRVETELPGEPVIVQADPDAITQVVYNLLDNAVKYSRERGCLWVSLIKRGGKLHVSVKNEGPTIPPDELPYVFERFHKADKSRGVDRASLGLGLYIVKTILGNMRESITVTSEDGVTEFSFTLSESKR